MNNSRGGFAILSVAALVSLAVGQHSSMPPGMSHEEHLKQMNQDAELKKRGVLAMRFDQDKASHHFYLTEAGGIIEVGVNETTDAETLRQVRDHLRTISQQFAEGVFASPVATHAEMPPGAPVMRERKARIKYRYTETPAGAQVVISTADRKALSAVHDFLKYQIRKHRTGDPISAGPTRNVDHN